MRALSMAAINGPRRRCTCRPNFCRKALKTSSLPASSRASASEVQTIGSWLASAQA